MLRFPPESRQWSHGGRPSQIFSDLELSAASPREARDHGRPSPGPGRAFLAFRGSRSGASAATLRYPSTSLEVSPAVVANGKSGGTVRSPRGYAPPVPSPRSPQDCSPRTSLRAIVSEWGLFITSRRPLEQLAASGRVLESWEKTRRWRIPGWRERPINRLTRERRKGGQSPEPIGPL